MKTVKYILLVVLLFFGGVLCGKLKFAAFKGPHLGFVGVKLKSPKLLGFKHHGLGLKHHGHGGGFHSSGYEHHEYHESHHSGGSFGGGGWLGK